MSDMTLFHEAPPLAQSDQQLVDAYTAIGRPLDDLPYTEDFDRLCQMVRREGETRDESEIFQRLLALRKAARLPRMGRSGRSAIHLGEDERADLLGMVRGLFGGTTGPRDRLPYTREFDTIVEQFNRRTGRNLEKHAIWRLVSSLSK